MKCVWSHPFFPSQEQNPTGLPSGSFGFSLLAPALPDPTLVGDRAGFGLDLPKLRYQVADLLFANTGIDRHCVHPGRIE
jgi:hypothetical protein